MIKHKCRYVSLLFYRTIRIIRLCSSFGYADAKIEILSFHLTKLWEGAADEGPKDIDRTDLQAATWISGLGLKMSAFL